MAIPKKTIVGLDYLPGQTGWLAWGMLLAALFCAWMLNELNVFHFVLWGQVEYLGTRYVDAWELVFRLHPHALRYLLVSPVYMIENYFGQDRDELYNFLVSFLLLFMPLYSYFYLSRLGVPRKRTLIISLLCLVGYLALGKFMHGRIIWAHLGILLVITAPLFHGEKMLSAVFFLFQLLVGVLMSSVSSGTLMVAYLSVASMTAIYLKRSYDKRRMDYARIVPLSLALLVFLPWLIVGTFKNVNFYGGGVESVVGMSRHGSLSTFTSDAVAQEEDKKMGASQETFQTSDFRDGEGLAGTQNPLITRYKQYIFWFSLLPVVILMFTVLYSIRHRIDLHLSLAWIALLLSLMVGQFGYSTLTLSIPLVILLMAINPFRQPEERQ